MEPEITVEQIQAALVTHFSLTEAQVKKALSNFLRDELANGLRYLAQELYTNQSQTQQEK